MSFSKYISIDEQGEIFFENSPTAILTTETKQSLLRHLVLDDQHRLLTHYEKNIYVVEAFDFPLIANHVYFEQGDLYITTQFDLKFKTRKEDWCLDTLDRLCGRTEEKIPFILSQKAQDQLFTDCQQFDDDSFTFHDLQIETPPYYLIDNEFTRLKRWDDLYEAATPANWDLQGPAPAIKDMLPRLKWPKSKILVLGCGAGHDAAYLAQAGHVVTAVDFSPSAIEKAKKTYGHISQLNFECHDVFNLPTEWNETFDIIVEHTLFCAIDPNKQKSLIQIWRRLLHEEGQILAIFFTMFKRYGPPYGSTEYLLRSLLKSHFQFLFWGRLKNSVPSRLGKELFVLAKKK